MCWSCNCYGLFTWINCCFLKFQYDVIFFFSFLHSLQTGLCHVENAPPRHLQRYLLLFGIALAFSLPTALLWSAVNASVVLAWRWRVYQSIVGLLALLLGVTALWLPKESHSASEDNDRLSEPASSSLEGGASWKGLC